MPENPRIEPDRARAQSASAAASMRVTPLHVVRFLVELFAFFTFAWWGFTSWPFAWNVVAGIGAPLIAIVVWGLFVSPKAVIRVHPFVRAIVELLVFAAATVAWWSIGQVWIGLAFALVAVVSGIFVGRERLS